jgi:hypothetical protein
MSYVIVSGPALSTTKSDAKYLALMSLGDKPALVCTITFAPNLGKQLTLNLNKNLSVAADFAAALQFIQTVAKQHKGIPVVAIDVDALVFSIALSTAMASTDNTIGELLATMNFVVDATAEATTQTNKPANSIRFTGLNIHGIKKLSSATDIKMTVTIK